MKKLDVRLSDTTNTVVLTKGNITLVIAHRDNVVLVVSTTHRTTEGRPFIPFVYYYDNSLETRERYLWLIGDLIATEEKCLAFTEERIAKDHCCIGEPRWRPESFWEQDAKQVLSEIGYTEWLASEGRL